VIRIKEKFVIDLIEVKREKMRINCA